MLAREGLLSERKKKVASLDTSLEKKSEKLFKRHFWKGNQLLLLTYLECLLKISSYTLL